MSVDIHILQDKDSERWDGFVREQPQGTLFHTTGWKRIIERSFGYQSHYLFAQEDGTLRGVLPLFFVKSGLTGRALISTPFAVYGGLLTADEEAENALLDAAGSFMRETSSDYVELRQLHASAHPSLHTRDSLYCTFIKPLSDSTDENFAALPRETRRLIRKARANGLEARFGNDQFDAFYHIYAVSVRNLGTPVFPKSHFKNCLTELGDDTDILVIYKDGRALSAVLSFYYKDTVLPYYGGSIPDARSLSPNNFMYWTLMEHASKRGCHRFDFGRSKIGSGASHFKRHMGFEPTTLAYQFLLRNGCEIPNNNPTNPRYRLAINLWRRLPLAVTKLAGPALVRHFP